MTTATRFSPTRRPSCGPSSVTAGSRRCRPSARRRRLLLDQVAQAFEPGRRYPESAVDEILKAVFDDHCALRRYLVDESFLSRTAAGVYWRAGGTVDA